MKYQLVTALLLTAMAAGFAPAAVATTWYVNGVTGSDSNNCISSTTACKSIGHAISFAASGDTIRVAAATYTEGIGFAISLSILGAGASTTIIDGGGTGRVVTISSSSAHVTLSGLTIRNGNALHFAAGIDNVGKLKILNSAVTRNTSGLGVHCFKSPCLNGGAGIFNHNGATLMISNSTVSANVVALDCPGPAVCNVKGGGILNGGTLRIIKSTISGNAAQFTGVGVSGGGGILSYNGRAVISNTTIAENTALSGGGIGNGGTVIISNTTIARNTGGGISNAPVGTATLQNNIYSSNSGGNCSGTMVSNGYNLSSDNTCAFSGPGDMNNTDPKLGPLQNNGGRTQTMALSSGSPAIDAGNPNGCTDGQGHLLTTDQRGMPRPDTEDSGGCDMGAYERQSD